jgi:hypothetical protein
MKGIIRKMCTINFDIKMNIHLIDKTEGSRDQESNFLLLGWYILHV